MVHEVQLVLPWQLTSEAELLVEDVLQSLPTAEPITTGQPPSSPPPPQHPANLVYVRKCSHPWRNPKVALAKW